MDKIFETALFTRKALINLMEAKSREELVKIPENFSNSIFWNIAHLLVTPQLLCYRRSGLEIRIDEEMVAKYGKGTKPTEVILDKDIDYVKEHLLKSIATLRDDYYKGVFSNYEPYLTSTKIELSSIKEALNFSAFHDGIHLGIILSLKKIV